GSGSGTGYSRRSNSPPYALRTATLPFIYLFAVGRSLNASSLSTRTSAGRPSTRSATMFFRISSVPAAIREPGVESTASWNAARDREQLVPVGAAHLAGREALVHLCGDRHAPPAADAAEPLAVRNPHVGEIDLVEVGGAGDLLDAEHFDARRLHVEEEIAEAL